MRLFGSDRMANIIQRKFDGEHITELARKIPMISWSKDNNFILFTAYRAVVEDSDGCLIVKVIKEEQNKNSPSSKHGSSYTYGFSVYRQQKYPDGEVREIFIGGRRNDDDARRLFNDIDMRDARRKLFEQ